MRIYIDSKIVHDMGINLNGDTRITRDNLINEIQTKQGGRRVEIDKTISQLRLLGEEITLTGAGDFWFDVK